MRELLGIYLRGFCMGAADAVPGVSGGTVALITGIYDRLVSAVSAADPRLLADAVRPHDQAARTRLRAGLAAMDLPFLLVLGAGIATAVVTAANVVEWALGVYRAETFAFFFGLIAASAVVLYGEVHLSSARGILVGALGVVVGAVLTGLPPGTLPHTPVVVFASGAVAVSAMVLPGISGSLLLIVLGQYEFMLGELRAFVASVAALALGGSGFGEAAVFVVAFLAGAVVGLLSVVHVIDWALEHYRTATLTFLVSLMVGALRKPSAEILANTGQWTPGAATGVVVAAVLGGGLVLAFDRYAGLDY